MARKSSAETVRAHNSLLGLATDDKKAEGYWAGRLRTMTGQRYRNRGEGEEETIVVPRYT